MFLMPKKPNAKGKANITRVIGMSDNFKMSLLLSESRINPPTKPNRTTKLKPKIFNNDSKNR